MRNQSCKIKKEVCITNNSKVWYPITAFEEEFSDNLTPTEILAHNRELLRQYYFATTIGKANDLLAELIKADPDHPHKTLNQSPPPILWFFFQNLNFFSKITFQPSFSLPLIVWTIMNIYYP